MRRFGLGLFVLRLDLVFGLERLPYQLQELLQEVDTMQESLFVAFAKFLQTFAECDEGGVVFMLA